MTFHSSEMEATSIGELLRETRMSRGLDLVAVAEQTRISPRNLQAIEDGNFASLPAEVFTRGFYTLYARMLSLDPDQVLEMYRQERKKCSTPECATTLPPNRLAQEMANLAERPTTLPFSYFGLILFLFLLFGAFLCWYFSWNPASYLSEKLRSLEEPQQSEQVMNGEDGRDKLKPIFETALPEAPYVNHSKTLNIFSPATVTAATTHPELSADSPVDPSLQPRYFMNAIFQEETLLSLQIDNQAPHTHIGKIGESLTWQASTKIVVTLPGDTRTQLTLNNIPVELPKAENETIRLSIPEDLLR